MKIKILGIGDLFIPASCIAEGLSALESDDVCVQTVDWVHKDEAELQSINSIVESLGCEAVIPPDYIFDLARDADIIVTQFCTITRALIDHCKNLKVIGVLRAGCENVNLDYATEKGILVVNTPGRNADAVADYTIGMMLAEARNIAKAHLALKQGEWIRQYPNSASIPDMCGKKVGLIGFGEIGRKVARRLAGFDAEVLCYDPFVSKFPDNVRPCDLPELMRLSDFVSIHVRSTRETENLVSADMIALMKPTAYLINTARPAIVDEDALYAALRDRRIAGAAIDVFNVEPPGKDYPLIQLDNITVTPHMAGGTRDAFYRSPDKLAALMQGLWNGEQPRNLVNPAVYAEKMKNRTAFFTFGPASTES